MGDGADGSGERGGEHATVAAARLSGRRAALALVLVVSIAFIVSSTAQIISAVFELEPARLPSGAPGSAERTCALGIQALAQALDHPPASDETAPAPPSSNWAGADAVENACAGSREGLDAWAALLRLRLAQSQAGRLAAEELISLRHNVSAHLPVDLR